jgi:hypothetical protein
MQDFVSWGSLTAAERIESERRLNAEAQAHINAHPLPAKRGITGKGGALRSWKRVEGKVVYNSPVWIRRRNGGLAPSPCGMRQRRGSRAGRLGRRSTRTRRSTRATSSSSPPDEPEPALAGSQLRSIGAALEAFLVSLLVKSAANSGCTLEEFTARVIAGWDEPAADLIPFLGVAAKAAALVSA